MFVGTVVRTDSLVNLLTQSTPKISKQIIFLSLVSNQWVLPKKDSTSQLKVTSSDLQWLARLKCSICAFLYIGTFLYVPQTSYKGSIIQPFWQCVSDDLANSITIPCGFPQFWVEGRAIATLGSYRCGRAWSSRETSAGESWRNCGLHGTSGRHRCGQGHWTLGLHRLMAIHEQKTFSLRFGQV